MKTKCGKNLRDLSRWVDGELKEEEGRNFSAHIETCAFCREEAAVFRAINGVLRSAKVNIQASPGFETVFWEKIFDRQRSPWLVRFLNNLEVLIPAPNLRRAVAFSILAFFIGNMGGVVGGLGQGASTAVFPASIRHFSSMQEFKGVSSYSLAAVYLKTIEKEVSE